MSKEKQCECCHEWWYASNIKQDLCPNCYDYFKQLKQQLVEKDKEIERLKVFEKAYYFNLSPVSKEYIKLMLQNAYQTPNQTQLAIQELEKVKSWCEENSDDLDDGETDERVCSAIGLDKPIVTGDMALYDFIDQQIKELKGESK